MVKTYTNYGTIFADKIETILYQIMIDERLKKLLADCQCVVFDLDGTLYNKRLLPLRMVLADWKHLGLLKSERAARKQLAGKYFGSSDELYKMLFSVMSQLSGKPVEEVKKWYDRVYMPTMIDVLKNHYKPASYTSELLAYLKKENIRTVVFSDYDCIKEKLRAIGLSTNDFAYIYSAPDMGGLKPCKEAFENMLAHIEIEPKQALMIGDRLDTDGAGANNVGMPFYQIKL